MYSKATSEQECRREHFLNLHTNIFKPFFLCTKKLSIVFPVNCNCIKKTL